ncbi:MAG TPA: hypothetical protein PLU30_02010 [Verrucomicrobiae bacterium]|nr:hypothetical protein [Verrucomicrobiae bacterium]
MVDAKLLAVLVCPETRQRVRLADAATVALLNAAIATGRVRNRAGNVVREPIDAALVRGDGAFCYPVRKGIPFMLAEEALALPPA